MLCAVLRNTTELRLNMFRWLADLVGHHSERFQNMVFIIDTEGSIGAKRDDLRIEGWHETENDRRRVLLWTIEVKVGASFHESSPLDDVLSNDGDSGLVNQIVNYDHWLEHQTVPNRAGFVLALSDMSNALPPNLNCCWRCVSWTKLGLRILDAIRSGVLPGEEVFLAKHLLGFIMNHLWRASEMTEFEINFDDVALMRAYAAAGRDSEDKINRLVESLIPIVEKSGIGEGAIAHQKSLYKGMKRSTVYRNLFPKAHSTNSTLWAGCTLTHMTIWLETAPGNENKAIVTSIMQSSLPPLKERNPGWRINEDQGWPDLVLEKPLATLLADKDQMAGFESFFIAALEDMRETGVVEKLQERLVS